MSNTDFPIEKVMITLDKFYPYHPMADVTERIPFRVLICCLLSIRSKDTITMPACSRLFSVVTTPQQLLSLDSQTLAHLIYPVQFYENKVDILKSVCQELLNRFNGQVPHHMEDLLSIKGVGRKTANLVLSLGFGVPSISVDTHVHRICNRLGYISSQTPEETEMKLRAELPRQYWNTINRVLVRHGQEICIAGHPKCDICPIYQECRRVNVTPRKPASSKNATSFVSNKNTRDAWGI